MGRNLLKLAVGVAALACLPAAADAAVNYSFVADSSNPVFDDETYAGGFVLTVDDYITSNQTFPASAFTSCQVTVSNGVAADCIAQQFFVSSSGDVVGFGFQDEFGGIASVSYFFDPGVFATNGAYETNDRIANQHATLTVSGFAEPSSPGGVPEPATWALMITGFGLAGSTLRRRAARAAAA